MAADKTIIWDFPLKGLSTVASRRGQPNQTSSDLLNVIPFDPLAGRARGGTRAGTAKAFATQLQAAPIQSIDQVTLALDPNQVAIDQTLLSEPFAYSDGNLGTLNNTDWETKASATDTATGYLAAAVDNTAVPIVSNRIKLVQATNATKRFAKYKQATVLGSTWLMRMTGQFHLAGNGGTFGFIVRYDGTNGTAAQRGITIRITRTGSGSSIPQVAALDGNGGSILAATSLPEGLLLPDTDFTFEVDVRGDLFLVVVNGLTVASFTSSVGSGQTGCIFYAQCQNTANQVMYMDSLIIATGQNLASYRQTNLVVTCSGSIYIGTIDTTPALVGNGSAVLSENVIPSWAFIDGVGYAVDGLNIIQLNLAGKIVVPYAATTGTAPTLCQMAALWQGRLVLASPRDNPQNWFMARIGTPTDWDYGQTDQARAIASSGSTVFGKLGDVPNALAPFSDDLLIFFCDHSIYQLTGNPAAGGNMDLVSDAVGGLGPNCWTKDPSGAIYFVGTAGFYRFQVGAPPENLARDSAMEFFRQINRSTHYVLARWDRDRIGCHIFVTNVNTAQSDHIWYDQRTEGFFPIRYPNDYGPICATIYDGDAAADRVLLMGGRTGYIYKPDDTVDADDGAAIESYVLLGPIRPLDDFTEAKTFAMESYLAERATGHVNNLDWDLRAGSDAYAATSSMFAPSIVARASDVVTVTATAHGLTAGDVITGAFFTSATDDFNGEFTVATTPTADTFTYAQEGADESPTLLGEYFKTNVATGSMAAAYGRQERLMVRLRGGSFAMRVRNRTLSCRFCFERFIISFAQGAGAR